MDGIEATRRIRDAAPDTKVILITVDESRGAISEAIQAGVSGYLLKDATARRAGRRGAQRRRGQRGDPPPAHPDLHRGGPHAGERRDRSRRRCPSGSGRSCRRWPTGPRPGRSRPIWASPRTRSRPTSSGSSRSSARTTGPRPWRSRSAPASSTEPGRLVPRRPISQPLPCRADTRHGWDRPCSLCDSEDEIAYLQYHLLRAAPDLVVEVTSEPSKRWSRQRGLRPDVVDRRPGLGRARGRRADPATLRVHARHPGDRALLARREVTVIAEALGAGAAGYVLTRGWT